MSISDGFQPGYTLEYDRYGNLVDKASSIAERYVFLGGVWRMGIPYIGLTAGAHAFLTFNTPATGNVFYSFAKVMKTGDEIRYTLNEGGTVANGTAMTPRNLNRIRGDTSCPFTAVFQGSSLDGTPMTLTGGTTMPEVMLPGTGLGSSGAGSSDSTATGMVLKPSTKYTIDITSVGAANIVLVVDVALITALT